MITGTKEVAVDVIVSSAITGTKEVTVAVPSVDVSLIVTVFAFPTALAYSTPKIPAIISAIIAIAATAFIFLCSPLMLRRPSVGFRPLNLRHIYSKCTSENSADTTDERVLAEITDEMIESAEGSIMR